MATEQTEINSIMAGHHSWQHADLGGIVLLLNILEGRAMSELRLVLEKALNELIFGNNYEAKLKVIQALAIIGANESVYKLRNTRSDLKAELVEAIEAKKCGKKLSLVDLGLDQAIEVINTILGEDNGKSV